jgi:hypothetical protein
MELWWNDDYHWKIELLWEQPFTMSHATFLTTAPSWIALGLNLVLCCEKSASNILSYIYNMINNKPEEYN